MTSLRYVKIRSRLAADTVQVGYWKAKADSEFIQSFRAEVESLWTFDEKLEEVRSELFGRGGSYREASMRLELRDLEGYQETRAKVARGLSRAVRISMEVDVPQTVTSYPAPAVGGPVIRQNILETILDDRTYMGAPRQTQIDFLERLVGATQDRKSLEFRRLVNPAWWLKEAVSFFLRIPFMLIEATGFDVRKIEEHLCVRVFKVLELVLIAYLVSRFGLNLDFLR